MKNSNLIWIIVLLSFSLALSGCGGKKEDTITPAPQAPQAPAPEAEEPELPTEGVQDVGTDVTQEEPAAEEQEEPEAEAPSDVTETPAEEESAPEEVNESAEDTALTADNYRVVSLKDLKAYPEEMRVKVGTTVEWRNVNDKLQHIIGWNGQRQMGVKPEPILAGESWSFTFNNPGTVKWFSTARPTIQGTIYITE